MFQKVTLLEGFDDALSSSATQYKAGFIGIDLGTYSTSVFVKGKGVVLNEPSVVAVRRGTNTIMNNGKAVGIVAHEMFHQTRRSIDVIRPLKYGASYNSEIAGAMLGYFIRKVQGKSELRPQVMVPVPRGITTAERQAIVNIVERAGVCKVYLVYKGIAAAIGAGLSITKPGAFMIVDIGGGSTEAVVINLADIVTGISVRVGGDDMDEAVTNHLKRTYNLVIEEPEAEKVKIQIGSAAPLEQELTMEVVGRDMVSGLPKKIIITSEEIREALKEPVSAIIDAAADTLEKADPELESDLVRNGIYICGGGSLLRGMDIALANTTGLKVRVVEEPRTCVARGLGVYLERVEL
jgi:rod shape-determining protein MreB